MLYPHLDGGRFLRWRFLDAEDWEEWSDRRTDLLFDA